ncbi:hypothetical protein F5Y19DRAFT_299305 [Xylariaceae sp. FL1651]|nr:hypothetical protein F5Y19DRAFT_299305 [Xylariaceae sp. FL1651]
MVPPHSAREHRSHHHGDRHHLRESSRHGVLPVMLLTRTPVTLPQLRPRRLTTPSPPLPPPIHPQLDWHGPRGPLPRPVMEPHEWEEHEDAARDYHSTEREPWIADWLEAIPAVDGQELSERDCPRAVEQEREQERHIEYYAASDRLEHEEAEQEAEREAERERERVERLEWELKERRRLEMQAEDRENRARRERERRAQLLLRAQAERDRIRNMRDLSGRGPA